MIDRHSDNGCTLIVAGDYHMSDFRVRMLISQLPVAFDKVFEQKAEQEATSRAGGNRFRGSVEWCMVRQLVIS
jgi:hypothetical protein